MATKRTILVGYFPVIQAGYLDFFKKYPNAEIGVLDSSILKEFDHLRKDIRALQPKTAAALIASLGREVMLLRAADLLALNSADVQVIAPDDELADWLEQQWPKASFTRYPVFLRWHRNNSGNAAEVKPHRTEPVANLSAAAKKVLATAEKSSNPWRRVGAAILRSGKIIDIASNQHRPSSYSPAIDGEPRMNFGRGVGIELSTDEHAEAQLISRAAATGTKLKGCEILVDTFPCPVCAKMISTSGIKRCYYIDGYAVTDGFEVMDAAGIEIVKLTGIKRPGGGKAGLRDYPEKN